MALDMAVPQISDEPTHLEAERSTLAHSFRALELDEILPSTDIEEEQEQPPGPINEDAVGHEAEKVEEEEDMFPNTASHLSSSHHDTPSDRYSPDPRLIPLPSSPSRSSTERHSHAKRRAYPISRSRSNAPSPESRRVSSSSYPRLPNRPPKGWKSFIGQSPFDTPPQVHAAQNEESIESQEKSPWRISSLPSIPRSRSTDKTTSSPGQRMPSVSTAQLIIGGRRVSGVMQYAMMRRSDSVSDSDEESEGHNPSAEGQPRKADVDVDDNGAASPQTSRTISSHGTPDDVEYPTRRSESVGSAEAIAEDDTDTDTDVHEGIPLPGELDPTRVRTNQDEDEIWMSYVRQQLGTLFPDFFTEAPQVPESEEIISDPPRMSGWEMVQDGEHHRPLSRYDRGLDVPNVRDEIGALREEIERMRGVVGGLAQGMRESRHADNGNKGVSEIVALVPGGTGAQLVEMGDEVQGGGEDVLPARGNEAKIQEGEAKKFSQLPPEFLETAHITMNLIRTLDSLLSTTSTTRSDEELFSMHSLQEFEARLRQALGKVLG